LYLVLEIYPKLYHILVLKVLLDHKDPQEMTVHKALKVLLDHKEHQENRVQQALKVQQVLLEQL
jgi:diphthamide biosynthesis methyltransferase